MRYKDINIGTIAPPKFTATIVLSFMVSTAGMQYVTPNIWMHDSFTNGVPDSNRINGILIPLPSNDAKSNIKAKPHEKPNFIKAVLAKPRNRNPTAKINKKDSKNMKIKVSGL